MIRLHSGHHIMSLKRFLTIYMYMHSVKRLFHWEYSIHCL